MVLAILAVGRRGGRPGGRPRPRTACGRGRRWRGSRRLPALRPRAGGDAPAGRSRCALDAETRDARCSGGRPRGRGGRAGQPRRLVLLHVAAGPATPRVDLPPARHVERRHASRSRPGAAGVRHHRGSADRARDDTAGRAVSRGFTLLEVLVALTILASPSSPSCSSRPRACGCSASRTTTSRRCSWPTGSRAPPTPVREGA